jgi:transposase
MAVVMRASFQKNLAIFSSYDTIPLSAWILLPSTTSGTYGPGPQATVALCTGAYRFAKRTTQQAMDAVFGVPMRVGTISQWEQATTAAVAAPVEDVRTYVRAQAVAYLDETSGRHGGTRAWLWGAVTSGVTVFVVRMSRGGPVARALLGETFAGILVTDRSSAYNGYPGRWRQGCWAPLGRDCEARRDRGGAHRSVVTPCWYRRTRCFPGGIGCTTAR